MKISHIVASVAVALCASQAGAQSLTFAAATAGNYSAIAGLTGGFTNYSGDVVSVATRPLFDLNDFSAITVGDPSPVATLTFAAGVTTFSFLWGSPDLTNSLGVFGNSGTATFTGSSAFGAGIANGQNANSQFVTVTDLRGLNKLTFSTRSIAFEVAQVSAVPEPETYALMLAGLGAVGFIARRRKSA